MQAATQAAGKTSRRIWLASASGIASYGIFHDRSRCLGNYFARTFSRSRMIPAKARNELFTALALGKTFATSASKTTTFVPCAKRRAYLPRTPREKSYRGRIAGSPVLLVAFFISFSFSFAGAPGADHADIITPFGMDDNQQFAPVGLADDDEPVLGL